MLRGCGSRYSCNRKADCKNASYLSKLLIQWLYAGAVISCLVEVIGLGYLQAFYYVVMVCQIARVASCPHFVLRRSVVLCFALILSYAAFSVYLVPNYDYYAVFIDAIPSILIWFPCVLIVSQTDFEFEVFCIALENAARWMTLLVLIALPLRLGGLLTYGTISHPATINALGFLLSFAARGGGVDKVVAVAFAFNAMTVFLFGGRSFALALGVATLVLWVFLGEKSFGKLFRFFLVGGVLCAVYFNLETMLAMSQQVLSEWGISSRNLTLLIGQLNSSGLYLANRDIVYEISMDIIVGRGGTPAGFGAIPAATNGAYYHPHNIVFQLILLFGYVGAFLFALLAGIRLFLSRQRWGLGASKALFVLAMFYMPYSLFNGTILTEPIAVLLFAALFFMPPRGKPILPSASVMSQDAKNQVYSR